MQTLIRIGSLSLLLILSTQALVAAPKDRSTIDAKHQWALTDIYADWEAWEMDLSKLESLMDAYADLQGTLASGPQNLLKAYTMREELGLVADRVQTYAGLVRALDNRDNEVYAKLQQVGILFSRFGTATSWFAPEMVSIEWSTMETWLNETPGLSNYRFAIEDLYRQQSHVLDEKSERLLSYFSRLSGTPGSVYNQLSTADIKFGSITLSTGEEVQISEGEAGRIFSTSRNHEDRKAAFIERNSTYNDNLNTYAASYDGICQRDWAYAQARNYSSTLERTLGNDNIPIEVYLNLLEQGRAGVEPLQRYHKLRKAALKLDEYDGYDSAVPVINFDKDYDYDDVAAMVKKSVKPLGKSYSQKQIEAFSPGWVDVYETPGKTTGAFSAGLYGVHPYMLLNYTNTLNDVFTVAHEMGHTVHTMFANETQTFSNSGYTLFVAEVASTMAEAHLLEYMLDKSKDPQERLVLLSHAIDNIAGTFYTQVMFADYEYQVHKLVEEGQPITADVLNGVYHEVLVAYYGDSMENHELYDVTWARIPHFSSVPYYVYQYATSYAASASLFKQMNEGSRKSKKQAKANYIDLLKSGGSDYPVEQLKKAGVDMTEPQAVQAVIASMDDLVSRYEKELKKLGLVD
ncbi:MAG: oligoendopeptidase F [Candidatus Marinimicrobia bacterium]|nr:oligoendopeptidase F [Candidatus Neomarinimicrobiota bacterium]MBT3576743.1 oligoendopeptidase F [Candidatus Neomarinimicrobiota bacterium]MBT3680424.1 oligoendopeptidase F [Candidatus Neomarinimicrobiota bacterium]MBT3951880.1 oligoendopeptidase F [Candidatus Neomarinimicrobiota bacterium]MBT4253848.1 oligoendopeptidase F [Candidatus Neomarinimicrobiota bacterium]